MIISVCRFDKCSTCVYDFIMIRTPVIPSCLIQQINIFGTGIHFSPTHTADIGIHTANAIVVVITGEFRSNTFYHKDGFVVVLGSKRVIFHELFARQ